MVVRPFSTREKIIFAACVILVGFYLIYYFGYGQLQKEIADQQERILKNEKELRKFSQVLRGEQAVEKKLNKYQELFKQRSSDEGEMTKILSDVEAAAQMCSMKIINMQPERIKKQDFYNYFSVNVQSQGSLKKICEFLYKLEASPYFFHIDEVRIEKYSIQAGDLKCQFLVSRFLVK
jgi:Tfp pilus assembly protein PilO